MCPQNADTPIPKEKGKGDMAQFSAKTKNARIQIAEEERLIGELSRIESEVSSIGRNLAFRVSAQANIRSRIQGARERIETHRNGMAGMKSVLIDILDTYDRTEQQVIDHAQVKETKIINAQEERYEYDGEESIIEDLIKPLLTDIGDGGEYRDYIIKRLESISSFKEKLQSGNISAVIGELVMIAPTIFKDKEALDKYLDKLKDGVQDKIEDLTGFDFDVKTKGSFYETEISGQYGSLGVTMSAYEAYANAKGGLFTENQDGDLVFNPNIDAKMGASYTLLTANGDIAVGNDMLGAHAQGEITAGRITGEASMRASMRDADGNFNPNAELHAGAEAVLVEAEAQAGVTVLGTDINASASAYVGVGAHADFKVGDGKVACDVGAALGIGVSISFEIDYGGTIDAIKKTAASVLSKIWPW